MAYDFDENPDAHAVSAPRKDEPKADPKDKVSPRDLEAIVTMMDIAALCLTDEAGATFTFEQMFAQMNELSGLQFEERDVRTVLATYPMIAKQGSQLSLR